MILEGLMTGMEMHDSISTGQWEINPEGITIQKISKIYIAK